jgi:hypothetical protein
MSVVLNDLQDMHRDAFADAPAPSLPIKDSKEMTPKSYTASGAIAPGRETARSFTRINAEFANRNEACDARDSGLAQRLAIASQERGFPLNACLASWRAAAISQCVPASVRPRKAGARSERPSFLQGELVALCRAASPAQVIDRWVEPLYRHFRNLEASDLSAP